MAAGETADPAAPARTRTFSIHAIHLMRTTQNNTLTLARMADQKASILLGATFIVFSLSVGRALAGDMPISLSILAGFSFLSSLCAVMAVLPSVKRPKGQTSAQNLLFFGHFARRDEEEWIADVLERLETDEKVYRTMAHDIYQNGQVLHGRKYRFLSLAYKMFMIGLFVTLIAFAVEMFALLDVAQGPGPSPREGSAPPP